MANGVTQIVKKNHKLEVFLKRNLDVDTFEKIRAHDPCIVCSEKEDKAFKYVILTDEWLYLTENPPKKIYETVHLKDIVAIELINDYPSFLQGDERDNVQHMVIRYRSDVGSEKQPKSGRQEKKNNGGDTDRSMSPGPPVTPRSSRNPIVLPYGRKSFSARETKEYKLQTARQLLAESRQCVTSRESSVNDLHNLLTDASSKRVQFGASTALSHTSSPRDLSPSRYSPSPRPISPILKRGNSPSRAESPGPNNGNASSKKSRRKQKKAKRNSAEGSSDTDSLSSRPLPSPRSSSSSESKLTPRLKGELKLDLSRLNGTSEDDDDDDDDEDLFNNSSDNSLMDSSRSKGPQILVTSDGTQSTEDMDSLATSLFGRESVIHLYILSKTSKILMLTKSAWHNYILRGTLEEDPSYVIRTTVIAPKSAQPTSEKLELLFRQLKTELQYTTNTMVDIFFHIHELKVAVDKNFALRKIFWKTPDVFRFMINQLKKYIPMTLSRYKHHDTEETTKTLRADELEFLNLILETLALLFREMEIVPTRIHMMKSEGGALTQSLVASLMASPETPEKMSRCISPRRGNLYETSGEVLFESEHDTEIHRLVREYKNTATTVLFELLMIGEQGAWVDKETSLLNVSWVVQEMHKSNQVDPFVEHMISEAMSMISPRRHDKVSPAEAMLLYHQFHILRTLIDFNDHVISFIQNNFYEEFKYYIQGPVLQRKLPASYLLRPYIFDLMENVISKVLQKTVHLSEV